MMKEYLTIKEAAEYLGLCVSTIRKYISSGKSDIPYCCVSKSGGDKQVWHLYRFSRTALDKWMQGSSETTDACGASGIT